MLFIMNGLKMENKKCENCKHWAVTMPPAIGTCKKVGKTTIFNHSCSQYEPNQIKDMANKMFGNNQQVTDMFEGIFKAK